MTSSSADWTFAGARLISSASRKLPNTGPSSVSKRPRVRPVDARADEVGGHEVGRELDAPEAAAEHGGERLDGERLGQPGHALEQHVAAGEQRDEQALEHRVLADDHALELVERLLEARARVLEDGRGGSWLIPSARRRGAGALFAAAGAGAAAVALGARVAVARLLPVALLRLAAFLHEAGLWRGAATARRRRRRRRHHRRRARPARRRRGLRRRARARAAGEAWMSRTWVPPGRGCGLPRPGSSALRQVRISAVETALMAAAPTVGRHARAGRRGRTAHRRRRRARPAPRGHGRRRRRRRRRRALQGAHRALRRRRARPRPAGGPRRRRLPRAAWPSSRRRSC